MRFLSTASLILIVTLFAGCGGENLSSLSSRDTILAFGDSLTALLEGGNDILRNVNSRITFSNLEKMIQLTKASGAEIILIGVPKKALLSDVSPIYPELEEKHDVLLLDDLINSMLRRPKYKSDAVHFNEAGYRKLAETIEELLKDNGAL